MHDDVFCHHRIAPRRLDLAKGCLRQIWMIDKGIDPGGTAEHGFQIRKDRQRGEIGMHEREIFDIRQLSRFGPDTDFQVGELFRERGPPRHGIANMFVEIDDKQRHTRLLNHPLRVVAGIRPISQNPRGASSARLACALRVIRAGHSPICDAARGPER